MLERREDQAEERGPQHDAGDHFADDLGLAESLRRFADEPACQQDQRCLQEEIDRQSIGRHGGGFPGDAPLNRGGKASVR